MSEKAVPQPEPPEEDVNTTPPNPPQVNGKSGWTMPQPVFRKTSGYLPQGYEKRFSQDELKADRNDDDSTAEMPAPDLEAVIEPQPDISEHIDDSVAAGQPTPAAAAPAKRSGAKIVLVILALLLVVGVVAALVLAFYFLYPMPSADSTF